MNIQPQVEASLERDVAPYAPEELLLTQQQRVQLLVGSRRVPAQCFAEELDPIGGRGCRTIRIVARKLPPPRSPDSRLLRSRQNSLIETVRQLQRQLAGLLVEIGNLQQQRALGLVAHVVCHFTRKTQISMDAIEAREDDDQHQYVRQCMDVPADLE